jgi:TRAP-type C4-dicarboxylate transport system substrate-binding protein
VLKAISFTPLDQVQNIGFLMLVERINKELKGELSIKVLGGPEVVPAMEQHEAARGGAVDICLTSCSYYSPLVKGLSEATMFTNLSEEELHASTEYYDQMVKLHETIGLRYLGDPMCYTKFFLWTNKKVVTPWDFPGQKIRGIKAHVSFIQALGASPVVLAPLEIYAAMERGVIDGFMKDMTGAISERHLDEVTKYIIEHGFHRGTPNILMNLDRWNKLPKELQSKIVKIKTDLNPEFRDYYYKRYQEDWKLVLGSPLKVIKFSPSEERAFLKLAYDSGWDSIMKDDPQLGPILKAILYK